MFLSLIVKSVLFFSMYWNSFIGYCSTFDHTKGQECRDWKDLRARSHPWRSHQSFQTWSGKTVVFPSQLNHSFHLSRPAEFLTIDKTKWYPKRKGTK
jgi:hypothetical protein